MGAMEIEGARERSPEATGKCPDMKGTRHMDAAARDGNVTEMLSKIRTSLLEGANGVDNDANAVSELGAFFRTYLQLFQSHPGIFRLFRSSEMRRRPSRVQIRIEYEGFFEWIRQAIATGVRKGSIRDDLEPWALALILTGMLETLTTRWLLSDCACTLEESAAGSVGHLPNPHRAERRQQTSGHRHVAGRALSQGAVPQADVQCPQGAQTESSCCRPIRPRVSEIHRSRHWRAYSSASAAWAVAPSLA